LLPYTINTKQISTTYLATDLSDKMIEVAHQNLQSYLDKIGVKEELKQWMDRHHLTLRAASGD